MNRKPIFDTVRTMLGRGFRDGEVTALDRAIDDATGVIVVTAPSRAIGPIALIDVSVLKAAAPEKAAGLLEPWVEPIRRSCQKYDIDNVRRIASFLGVFVGHESSFDVGKRENMNYSAKRMSEVWPSRFAVNGVKGNPNSLAKALDRKPEEIANHVYANRMGNGPPQSGDGWRYRGNGPPQLTGKDNHKAFALAIGKTVQDASDYIMTLEGGIEAAAWFWNENLINVLADTPGLSDETRRINGGLTGLADRTARFNRVVARLMELGA